MSNSGILAGKNTLVFGAGGSLGRAVASEFAAEGAAVFLSGRSAATVKEVADRVSAAGGNARVDVVDASDTTAVDEYVAEVIARVGRIDAVCNLTGPRIGDYYLLCNLPASMSPVPGQIVTQKGVLRQTDTWAATHPGYYPAAA